METEVSKAKKKCDDLLVKTWDDIKNDLYNGKVKYNDLDLLLTYKFLKQFDEMFSLMKDVFEKNLSEISHLYRAASGKWNNFDRFIPKEEFKSLNRFNPPEELFIYLGISSVNDDNPNLTLNDAEETCLKEIRVNKGQEVSLCEFKVNSAALNKKVIDISIADNFSFDELNQEKEVIKNRIKLSQTINLRLKGKLPERSKSDIANKISQKSGNVFELSKVLSKIYMKMISADLFLPVDGLDRNYEYAPFHAFANYFRSKGYSGIIFKSTVNPGHQNLVLFNINDVTAIGKIKTIIY